MLQPDFTPSKRGACYDVVSSSACSRSHQCAEPPASTSTPTLGDAYLFIEDADALFAE